MSIAILMIAQVKKYPANSHVTTQGVAATATALLLLAVVRHSRVLLFHRKALATSHPVALGTTALVQRLVVEAASLVP